MGEAGMPAMKRPTVRCDDCEGTGAEEHDCWVCKGDMYIPVARIVAEGFSEDEIEDVEDGTGRCPSCHGWTCHFYEGDGTVDVEQPQQQEDRVLICALDRHNRIPPLFSVDWRGRLHRNNDQLLSTSAAARLSERGQLLRLIVLAFGDEISLQGDGHVEAKAAWRRHRERWKRWIADERLRRADRANREAGRTINGKEHDGMPA